jgi:SAM-dependent methyltransferase
MKSTVRSQDHNPDGVGSSSAQAPLRWLNVGSGPAGSGLRPPGLRSPEWQELRVDADPSVKPDIVAPADDLRAIEEASVDAVFSSHCIEHLYLDQALPALREWKRVLRDKGFLLLVCPDLQAAADAACRP